MLAKRIPDAVEYDDLLLLWNEHIGIEKITPSHSPNKEENDEYIIEEHCPWAIYRKGEFIPIGNKVMVRMVEEDKIGGIDLPGWESGVRNRLANVIATGTGTLDKSGNHVQPLVEKGDTVIINASKKGWKLNSSHHDGDIRFFEESEIDLRIREVAA